MGHDSWRFLAPVLIALPLGLGGCMTTPDARYVYQDGQFGVIGIPRNTSLGKKDYRSQAHELMIKHFPEGYEIVRAEEVVEGERTLDTARKVDFETDPGVAALNQIIKVGKLAKSETLDQKDSVKITESRIIYRRKPNGHPTGNDGFTSVATLAPELYIDPNELTRKELKDGTYLAKKDSASAKKPDPKAPDTKTPDTKADPTVQKAANSASN
jgi:hypothetical protein